MKRQFPQGTPTFEAEVARFQQFLRATQWPERIVWIQRQDLLLTGKRFCYLKIPVPKSRDTAARQAFDKGIQEGRGVLLASRFELQERAIATDGYRRMMMKPCELSCQPE